ncbi:GFA family protein [Novosphingobium sp.]|uniref:GFA family protein n=1 Tax=Novosphingobium sp. TaxID=1874826 RepID=UPI00261786A4|nr:GFA family protein [Novosphingobium sp.]
MQREGGCACGAIRFEAEIEPMVTVACHCGDCQKLSGGGPNYFALLPSNTIRLIQGSPLIYERKADSGGTIRRAFCATCGSHLWGIPSLAPFMTVKVGAFHDTSDLGPMMHIHTASAPAWHPVPRTLPKFPRMLAQMLG